VEAALAAAGLGPCPLRDEGDRVVVSLPERAAAAAARLREAFGGARVAPGEGSLAQLVGASLKSAGATLALAESCTGGLIAKLLTDVAGSSAYLLGGVVAYANEAKVRLLGVPADEIARYGAVSRPVVEAMARGAARVLGADYAAAVSGIAGPDGGTADKPVGTVWIAVCGPRGDGEARRFVFDGDRERVRDLAAWNALVMLEARVLGGEADSSSGARGATRPDAVGPSEAGKAP
jgi:PncC family amidohydrolase